MKKICEMCQKEFVADKKTTRFCSLVCFGKSKHYEPIKKLCEICKSLFETKSGNKEQKFCSSACFHKYRMGLPLPKKGVYENCETCGAAFYVTKAREGKAMFCSNKCKGIYYLVNKSVNKKCLFCGTEFPTSREAGKAQLYCTVECRRKAGYMRYKSPKIIICNQCGKEFTINKGQKYQTHFCSQKCRNKNYFENHSLQLYSRNGLRRALQRRGVSLGKCSECGYAEHPEILGVHHKDFDPKNGTEGNLVVLCPICHSLAHKRHLINPPGQK